ncbi:hemolysin family protein [Treponema pedis]|uniref:Uncharacterized protein n=3 Tax=Treponema pedis TaxID=409322 RepID=S5ZSC8_9SPIR|nr:hemolysin family protein [Treponema pedis]AGT42990.1 hypothetical protein TPE_0494 [Treponema pedis str. T A4]QOW60571.1 HlyC/CorC family transporter [Treponema pedis]
MNLILLIIEFTVLLLCAAFFSGTETGITAITRSQYKTIKKSKTKTNKRISFLIEKKDEIVSATLIGTNFVNTLSSGSVTAFVLAEYGQKYLPSATAITAILIIIFAEILPKAFATQKPVELTKAASHILCLTRFILKPPVFIFSAMSKFIIKVFSKNKKTSPITLSEDYLKTLIDISLADGTFQTGEHALIMRAVKLHELKLHSIMTKKEDMTAIEINSSFDTMVETFKKTMFSRLPVFDTEKDNIAGIIHYKDLLFYKTKTHKKNGINIRKIIRPTIFIPKTANIFSALKTMSKNKKNMAFIIDEYGNTAGLITIDDISSAIFGSIQDEYSKIKNDPAKNLSIIDGNHIRIPAAIPIIKLNEILRTNFHSEYNSTIGGLILERAEYLPKENETIKIGKVEFTVEKIENSKIISLIADVSELIAG